MSDITLCKRTRYAASGRSLLAVRGDAIIGNRRDTLGALRRLEDFEGTEDDVRHIAELLESRGDDASAQTLFSHLEP